MSRPHALLPRRHLEFPTRHRPLFFSLVPVVFPPLLLLQSQHPELATLATIDISPLSSRVLSPSQPLLELPRNPPSPLLPGKKCNPRQIKNPSPQNQSKTTPRKPMPKFQYAIFAPAPTSHERLVDKSRLKRTGMRGGPPPPGE